MNIDDYTEKIDHVKRLLLELPPEGRLMAIDDICHDCGRSYAEMHVLVCECAGGCTPVGSRKIKIIGSANANEKPAP